jgi:ribonuclease Z
VYPRPACTLIDSATFNARPDTDHDKAGLLHALRLQAFESVVVEHCRAAFGAVLTDTAGHRIVYSGDTRPCARLLAANGAPTALLIHEATFADDLLSQATAKRHSTMSEALEAGARMHAACTLLTHFSQRYAAGPPLPDHAHGEHAVLAFDGLRLSLPVCRGGVQGPPVIEAWRAAAAAAAKSCVAPET